MHIAESRFTLLIMAGTGTSALYIAPLVVAMAFYLNVNKKMDQIMFDELKDFCLGGIEGYVEYNPFLSACMLIGKVPRLVTYTQTAIGFTEEKISLELKFESMEKIKHVLNTAQALTTKHRQDNPDDSDYVSIVETIEELKSQLQSQLQSQLEKHKQTKYPPLPEGMTPHGGRRRKNFKAGASDLGSLITKLMGFSFRRRPRYIVPELTYTAVQDIQQGQQAQAQAQVLPNLSEYTATAFRQAQVLPNLSEYTATAYEMRVVRSGIVLGREMREMPDIMLVLQLPNDEKTVALVTVQESLCRHLKENYERAFKSLAGDELQYFQKMSNNVDIVNMFEQVIKDNNRLAADGHNINEALENVMRLSASFPEVAPINTRIIDDFVSQNPAVHLAIPFDDQELLNMNKNSMTQMASGIINDRIGYMTKYGYVKRSRIPTRFDAHLEKIWEQMKILGDIKDQKLGFYSQVPFRHDGGLSFVVVLTSASSFATLILKKSVFDMTPLMKLLFFKQTTVQFNATSIYIMHDGKLHEFADEREAGRAAATDYIHLDFKSIPNPYKPRTSTRDPYEHIYSIKVKPMFAQPSSDDATMIQQEQVRILNLTLNKAFVPPGYQGGNKSFTVHVLGRLRRIHKQGRTQYVTYKKELIKLSDAKKLEKKLNKAKS